MRVPTRWRCVQCGAEMEEPPLFAGLLTCPECGGTTWENARPDFKKEVGDL